MTYVDEPLLQAYLTHRSRLLSLATRVVGCRWKGEDIVQDAYFRMRAADGQAAGSVVRRPFQYLWSVVYRLALDARRDIAREEHRRASPRSRHEDEGQSATSSPPGDTLTGVTTPEQEVAGRDELRKVIAILQTLPPRTRQAFELHQIQGHTQREVAEILGISCPRVSIMIRTAARRLNDAFDADA
ncbi:sigma-70 family RNA polymerase sigma factor [Gluconacetobacter sp. 1c LMG 22058]|uniref:Sigma-70 family RNA polymerase sigma factor n=1 Tax=Gluconacetobacter dulcium TaxID=2729096 RepID=A0A7W4JWW4_9PROT|nr:sigma-70 family RNA polymerase sigma factor [Gluconacetobacter dulcium]